MVAQQEEYKKNNKMSSDTRSVPDLKITKKAYIQRHVELMIFYCEHEDLHFTLTIPTINFSKQQQTAKKKENKASR